jgi:hypothetical protein
MYTARSASYIYLHIEIDNDGQPRTTLQQAYALHVATRIFNYKQALQDFNIDDPKSNPPDRTCASSLFK